MPTTLILTKHSDDYLDAGVTVCDVRADSAWDRFWQIAKTTSSPNGRKCVQLMSMLVIITFSPGCCANKWMNADLGHFCVAYIQAKLDQENLLTQQRQYIQPMLV